MEDPGQINPTCKATALPPLTLLAFLKRIDAASRRSWAPGARPGAHRKRPLTDRRVDVATMGGRMVCIPMMEPSSSKTFQTIFISSGAVFAFNR